MVNGVIESLTHLIIQLIQQSGYLGVFILMMLESALIPIPSEVTMPFAGYLTSLGTFNIYLVILVGAFANLVGSLIAYALGYWGEETFVRNLIKKYGKYILITVDEYDRADKWFKNYGDKIVFFSRILPIVRTFISLPAGLAEMNIWKFSIFTFIGSLIWSTVLTLVGYTLGKNWHSLEGIYRKFEYIIVAALVLLIGYYIYHKWKKLAHKHK